MYVSSGVTVLALGNLMHALESAATSTLMTPISSSGLGLFALLLSYLRAQQPCVLTSQSQAQLSQTLPPLLLVPTSKSPSLGAGSVLSLSSY